MPPVLNDHTSIYLQIAKMLEDGILRGIYPEETQVPSTNELARTLRINPATGAKGLNPLAAEARKLGIQTEELQAMLAAACQQEE